MTKLDRNLKFAAFMASSMRQRRRGMNRIVSIYRYPGTSKAALVLAVMIAAAVTAAGSPAQEQAAAPFMAPQPKQRERLFEPSDLPAAEFREGAQGVVAATLVIDLTGTPLRCDVYASSGSPGLDEAACKVWLRRARFTAATGVRGDAVYGSAATSITWTNPNAWAKAPGNSERTNSFVRVDGAGEQARRSITLALLVDKDGSIEGCKPHDKATDPRLSAIACDQMVHKTLPRLLDGRDQPVRSVRDSVVTFTGAQAPALPARGKEYRPTP